MNGIFRVLACLTVLVLIDTSALALSPSSFEVGMQVSDITYKEPGLMRESGIMYGVNAAYVSMGKNLMWKVDGMLSTGTVEYVGAYSDGTPLTMKGIRDTMFEARAVLGPTDFVSLTSFYLPYVGIGYRYLYDGANVAPGGYRRESNYVYIPLGIEGMTAMQSKWRIGFTLEYDFFISGTQHSYLSDADPGYNDISNNQSSGYGYRASLRFIRPGKHDIIFEPFYKYWKIDESSVSLLTYYGSPYAYMVEPANNSTEIGIRVILRF